MPRTAARARSAGNEYATCRRLRILKPLALRSLGTAIPRSSMPARIAESASGTPARRLCSAIRQRKSWACRSQASVRIRSSSIRAPRWGGELLRQPGACLGADRLTSVGAAVWSRADSYEGCARHRSLDDQVGDGRAPAFPRSSASAGAGVVQRQAFERRSPSGKVSGTIFPVLWRKRHQRFRAPGPQTRRGAL